MGETLPLFRASFNLLREIMERTRILEWLAGRLARLLVRPIDLGPLRRRSAGRQAEGRRICIELMQGLQDVPGVAGVHIMAPNQSMESVARVIDEAGLRSGYSVA